MTETSDAGSGNQGSEHGHDGLPPMTSVKRWLVTTNHKDVGLLYIFTSLFFLVMGGILALLMRLQLWVPGDTFISAFAYNQAVTGHGLLMVFFFLSPFAFGFANYIIPLQIGAKDLAFPRLNALSYWLFLFSGILFGTSFFQEGSLSGGWTLYAPLTIPTYMPEIGATTAILAMGMFVISITVSSVNFLTTMHNGRAPGMRMRDMPMFSWSILLTVWMMLFAFAALLAAFLLLGSDRLLGTLYYEATVGGALLWAHLFWFFGHPEVYIVFFPALGVMYEVFQTFSGRRIVGRKWIIAAMILVAVQSFLVWMHHMFLTGINLEAKTLFMATTIGISLPFDLIVFALIYTLVKGRLEINTPFLFCLGALVLFIIGGITGVFLGAIVLDYEFRGTYWVVAHFHYVMVSGVTALIGGLYYWWPKFTGKMYSEKLGKLNFAAYFIGFNLLYFPMFLAWESPRRVFEYPEAFTIWHQAATIGGFLLAGSFLILFYNLYVSYHRGEEVGDNPWTYSRTTEWAIESPPELENFPGIPSYESGTLEFLDSVTPSGAATDGGTAHAQHHGDHHPDHASIWPAAIAASLFLLFLGASGYHSGGAIYTGVLGLGVVAFLGSCLGFGFERFEAPEVPYGERWPVEGVEKNKLGVWIFLASDVIVFGAVIGAFLFMRYRMGWHEWHVVAPSTMSGLLSEASALPGLINTYVLLTSSFTVVLALVFARRKHKKGMLASMIATFVLATTFLGVKYLEWSEKFAAGHGPSYELEYSVYYVTTGLHGVHVVLGMMVLGFLIFKGFRGSFMEDNRAIEYFGLYWHFVDIVWVFLFPLFYLI